MIVIKARSGTLYSRRLDTLSRSCGRRERPEYKRKEEPKEGRDEEVRLVYG